MTLNIGIIGCGDIAFNKHMPTLYAHPEASLKAFYNRTYAKAQKAMEQFGNSGSKVYQNASNLLNDETIDAVYILTANDTHHTFAIEALEKGKHVMVEKPLAHNYPSAKAMVSAAKNTDKVLSVAYQNRGRGDVQQLKKHIDDGVLGEIYAIKAASIRRRGIPTWGVFTNKAVQGGGPLIDIGSHVLDLALYFIDYPGIEVVTGTTYQAIGSKQVSANRWGPWDKHQYTVEDSAFAFLKTKQGQTIQLEASYALNEEDEGENALRLYGAKAGAYINDETLRINWVDDDYRSKTLQYASHDAAFEETDAFIKAIQHGTRPLVTMDEALLVNEIIETIYNQNQM